MLVTLEQHWHLFTEISFRGQSRAVGTPWGRMNSRCWHFTLLRKARASDLRWQATSCGLSTRAGVGVVHLAILVRLVYALPCSSSRERSEAQLRIEIATRQRRVERVDLLEGAAFMLKRGPRYGRIVMILLVLTLDLSRPCVARVYYFTLTIVLCLWICCSDWFCIIILCYFSSLWRYGGLLYYGLNYTAQRNVNILLIYLYWVITFISFGQSRHDQVLTLQRVQPIPHSESFPSADDELRFFFEVQGV